MFVKHVQSDAHGHYTTTASFYKYEEIFSSRARHLSFQMRNEKIVEHPLFHRLKDFGQSCRLIMMQPNWLRSQAVIPTAVKGRWTRVFPRWTVIISELGDIGSLAGLGKTRRAGNCTANKKARPYALAKTRTRLLLRKAMGGE